MDEFGISQLLREHLREATGVHVVDAVESFRAIHVSAHRVLRSPWRWWGEVVHPGDIAIVLATEGSVRLSASDGRSVPPGMGEAQRRGPSERPAAVACPSGAQATLWFSGPDPACVIIWIPSHIRDYLGIAVTEPIQLRESMLVSVLRSVARHALKTGRLRAKTMHEDFVLERVLLSLVIGVLSGETREVGTESDRLEQARTVMLANVTDPDFTVESLAEALNISPRQLQRHYAQLDTTPRDALRGLRLEFARELMRAQPPLSRKQIAARAGFRSVAALRRALSAYGEGDATPEG